MPRKNVQQDAPANSTAKPTKDATPKPRPKRVTLEAKRAHKVSSAKSMMRWLAANERAAFDAIVAEVKGQS